MNKELLTIIYLSLVLNLTTYMYLQEAKKASYNQGMLDEHTIMLAEGCDAQAFDFSTKTKKKGHLNK